MSEILVEKSIEQRLEVAIPAKELILFSIPLSLLFAISGMDCIGFISYHASKEPKPEIYTRSLLNVLLLGFLSTAIVLFVIPFLINRYRWKKPQAYFGTQKGHWN